MTLAASSILHYWSARQGATPTVGGKPVHTRNSAARIADQRGVLHAPIINTPRIGWDTIDSERRPTMLMELARTNAILYSADYSNAAWTKTTMTVTTGIDDPMGGTSACTLTATGVDGAAVQTLADSTNVARTASLWIRRRTGTGAVYLYSPMTGGGFTTITITDKWARYSNTGSSSITRRHGVSLNVSGDAIDVWCAQTEDGESVSSEIPTTTAAATRSADSFYWDYTPAPQGLMFYCRFVERGSRNIDQVRIWQIGKSDNTNAKLYLVKDSGFYTAVHRSVASLVVSALAVLPGVGDTVELLFVLDASGRVTLVQSINGAAVTSGAASGTLTIDSVFSDTKLWLNSVGTTGVGANSFAEVKIVKYADVVGATAQTRMDELRAFEVNAAGTVLA